MNTSTTLTAILVSLIPFSALWIAINTKLNLHKASLTVIQSIASGFILASIILDLAPRMLASGASWTALIAFIVAIAFMLWVNRGGGCCSAQKSKPLKTFLFPFAVEFFITGVLIGIATITSKSSLIIIALSFGLCNLVCGLSISVRLTQQKITKPKRLLVTACLSTLLPLFAFISATFVSMVPTQWLDDLLSFAIAILLYLVLAELFPEAISYNKRNAMIALFSAFSFVYLLNVIITGVTISF